MSGHAQRGQTGAPEGSAERVGGLGQLSYGVYVVIQTLALLELENRREKINRGQMPPGLHAGTDRARDKNTGFTLDLLQINYIFLKHSYNISIESNQL